MQLNFYHSFCASERETGSVQQSMDIPIAFSEQRDKAAVCLKLTSLRNDSCLLGISLCKLKISTVNKCQKDSSKRQT